MANSNYMREDNKLSGSPSKSVQDYTQGQRIGNQGRTVSQPVGPRTNYQPNEEQTRKGIPFKPVRGIHDGL